MYQVQYQYEDVLHLHLGYYKKGYDFQAIALKALDRNKWLVFFPFDEYQLAKPPGYENAYFEPGFGNLIFTGQNDRELPEKFHEWVETQLIPNFN